VRCSTIPGLVVACVVGDGEAETGPAGHGRGISNKFLDPVTTVRCLPILHLNGYKISNPTVLARIHSRGLEQTIPRLRMDALLVECQDNESMHEAMATTLDNVVTEIKRIQHDARIFGNRTRPRGR